MYIIHIIMERVNDQPFANIKNKKIPTENITENIQYNIKENSEEKINDQIPYPPPELNNTLNVGSIESSFIKKVEDYISLNNPLLCIMTPFYGGICHVKYMACIMDTIELFKKFKFKLKFEICSNDSLISRARNNLIAKALTNEQVTHLLFIDSDICWNPIDILKLILNDKPIIGGAYPLKHYYWDRLLKDVNNPYNSNIVQSILDKKNSSYLKNHISDIDAIQSNMVKYNVNYISNAIEIDMNLTKVKHIATGFMMIKRNTLEEMIKKYPETKYTDDIGFLTPHENNWAYALFDCGVRDDHYYSEDWLFCDRWTKMNSNNDIYLDISINLTHIGLADYKGCLISTLI